MALSWTLDKLGPFARSAEDCGLILQTIAGKDSNDPGSAGKSFYYTPQYARPMKDLRVGYAPADFAEWAEPATRPAFEAAIGVLKASGMQFVETKLPDLPYGAALSTILAGEMGSIFETLIASGKVEELADKPQIAGLKASLELPAKDYLKAMRLRRLMQEEVGKLFGSVDVLLAPGRAAIASKIDQPLDRGPRGGAPPKDPGFRAIIPMGNLAGLPALVLPCGFADNMPVALQVVGVPFSENTLLAIGREFQSRTDWHKRRPPAA
jgi:aspartyl-tRNA(Asn)/glutamyl-tRNA(Gln) amidotransferase subunit A